MMCAGGMKLQVLILSLRSPPFKHGPVRRAQICLMRAVGSSRSGQGRAHPSEGPLSLCSPDPWAHAPILHTRKLLLEVCECYCVELALSLSRTPTVSPALSEWRPGPRVVLGTGPQATCAPEDVGCWFVLRVHLFKWEFDDATLSPVHLGAAASDQVDEARSKMGVKPC